MFLSLTFLSFPFSWQSTSEEEDGVVPTVIVERALIHSPPDKGSPLLGVSTAGTVAFWKAAYGLWSPLQE